MPPSAHLDKKHALKLLKKLYHFLLYDKADRALTWVKGLYPDEVAQIDYAFEISEPYELVGDCLYHAQRRIDNSVWRDVFNRLDFHNSYEITEEGSYVPIPNL